MHPGMRYGLLAGLLGLLASLVRPLFVRVGFGWAALAAVWFAIGSAVGWGGLLLKSKEGRLPWWIKLVLGPVLLGTHLYNRWKRARDSVDAFTEVRPGIWLGRRVLPGDLAALRELDIGAVLDVTAEFDSLPQRWLEDGIQYLNVPVFDHAAPLSGQLEKAVRWIIGQREAGRAVLIHCALGQGRSATVLLAYLQRIEPERTLESLLAEVKARRGTVAPNRRQWRSLQRMRQRGGRSRLHARLLFNPGAGNRDADADLALIRQRLEPFLDLEVVELQAGDAVEDLAKKAVLDKVDQLLVAGGDGTVAAAAHALAGKKTVALGIIPRGTANALAVCLMGEAVRVDPIGVACEHILSGQERLIDAVRWGRWRWMLQLAGVGVEAGMIERATGASKEQWGALAYLAGGLQQLGEQPAFSVELDVDGRKQRLRALSVVVANAAPPTSLFAQGGGIPDFEDGQVDVTVLLEQENGLGTATAVKELVHGMMDDTVEQKGIVHCCGKEVHLVCDPPQHLAVDGELHSDHRRIRFLVVPQALRVLAMTPPAPVKIGAAPATRRQG